MAPMDDSGAILRQISSLKDMLDQVNEEIEQNIQRTREKESDIVKCSEVENEYLMKESEFTKGVAVQDFELNGLIQVSASSRKLLEAMERELGIMKLNMDETVKRISEKRENFIFLSNCFQSNILASENGELASLLSQKEALESEKHDLKMKINALQNATNEYLAEILEEIQISNSALEVDIQHDDSKNKDLLKDISELKILLSSLTSGGFSW